MKFSALALANNTLSLPHRNGWDSNVSVRKIQPLLESVLRIQLLAIFGSRALYLERRDIFIILLINIVNNCKNLFFILFGPEFFCKPKGPKSGSGMVFWIKDINGTSDTKSIKKKMYKIFI